MLPPYYGKRRRGTTGPRLQAPHVHEAVLLEDRGQIRLRHISGNVWWDLTEAGGPNWDSNASLTDNTAWFTVTTTNSWANWYYNTAVPNWISGLSYAVSMRVTDAAGNPVSNVPVGYQATNILVLDSATTDADS